MSEKPRQVQFFPRQVIEGMPHGDPRTALISITDPGDPARLPDGWAGVLRLEFDDIVPPLYEMEASLMSSNGNQSC